MIRMQGVHKNYPRGNQSLTALAPTDLTVEAGEFLVLVGRSGAGKSTLLGMAGGLLRPTGGEVSINGMSLWALDEKTRAQIRARKIGFVFQNASVIPSLNLLENITLAHSFIGGCPESAERRARVLLADVGLEQRGHDFPEQISGGEKRRVAVASALINNPPLLLADEPTGELDEETENRIMALLQRVNAQGTTILLVTHNRELRRYGHRVLTMETGRLINQEEQPCEG